MVNGGQQEVKSENLTQRD